MMLTIVLWLAALGSGAMAGIYFAFSAFIMRSLAAIPEKEGIAAMQSINRVIVASPFLPLFFGTTLLSLGLAVVAAAQWSAPGSMAALGGALVYIVGMFVFTVAFNVPLNNALEAVEPESSEGASVWSRYQLMWTRWNHVRTIASLVSSGLFVHALIARAGLS